MNVVATILLLVGVAVACADWLAVTHGQRRVEYVCKPAVIVLLVGSALALQPVSGTQRAWVVVALALSLAGDVALVLPRERFEVGLGAFLLAHAAYVVAFISSGFSAARAAMALTGLLIVGAVLMQRVVRGLRAGPHRTPVAALVTYGVALSATVMFAFASRQPLAVVPAMLFYISDSVLATRRFIRPRPWMPLAVIVTYHLAQVGFVVLLAL
ncbi:MAG: lysoplasmalogenase [Candidatus Dormibacteria bacterium]